MHVRMANLRAGGKASLPLSPKLSTYRSFAAKTSFRTSLIVCPPFWPQKQKRPSTRGAWAAFDRLLLCRVSVSVRVASEHAREAKAAASPRTTSATQLQHDRSHRHECTKGVQGRQASFWTRPRRRAVS